MDGTEQVDFVTGIYRYAQLERGLASALGVQDAKIPISRLRGRLKKLATLGLPASAPGRGVRRLYSLEEAHQLLVALVIENMGIDPVVIAPAVKGAWSTIGRAAREATSERADTNPTMLHVRTEVFTGPPQGRQPVWIAMYPRIDEKLRAWYREHNRKDESDEVLIAINRDDPGLITFFNYTSAARKLEAVLAAPMTGKST